MSPHPARSLEFLSRLHDGELSPEERARFESHRSHCDECRRSVAEYETSISVFRGARGAGPPPDLAARILRRLEASNRRRGSFGVVFGIDVKWAGALTAALIAVILGYSLVDRQREARRIPVSFVEPTAPASTRPEVAAAPARAPAPEKAKGLRKESAVAASADARRRDPAAAPPPPAAAPEPSRSNAADEKLAAAAPPKAERPSSRSRTAAAHEGGEGASPAEARERVLEPKALRRVEADVDVADASSAAPPAAPGPAAVRVTVTPLDTLGTPPAVLAGSSSGLSERERGRYVVVVGPSGVPVAAEREIGTRQEVAGDLSAESPLAAIRRLRFAPGDRVRRLLVQIDADAAPR